MDNEYIEPKDPCNWTSRVRSNNKSRGKTKAFKKKMRKEGYSQMLKSKKGVTLLELLMVVLVLLIAMTVIGSAVYQPYHEMKTFNKFSTTKATYLDAVFSKLRIINN